MPTVNKPNSTHEAHRSNSDHHDGMESVGNGGGFAANSVISSKRAPEQRKEVSSVDKLHRAWRQMVSSFLVAARTPPTTTDHRTPEQIHDQEKIRSDAIETTLRSRSELRLLLSVMEESFTGKEKKRRALLEEELYSLPTATYRNNLMSKRRRREEEQNCWSNQGRTKETIDSLDTISLPI